jgi:nucleoside-diphosphate-sugar epimerase
VSSSSSAWEGKRTLVSGATGFIGQHLVRRLVGAGAQVWAGVFAGEAVERVNALPQEAMGIPLDVRDADAVRRAIEASSPSVVFHLAAIGVTDPNGDPHDALAVNVGGTLHLLDALSRAGCDRAVLVGTCYEYGSREAREALDPFNFYAASKVAAWAFARAYWHVVQLPVVVARPFQVYGPGQARETLIPSAIRAALTGADFPMTPGEQRRDFILVDDVVTGLLASATAPGAEGQSLDLGTGRGTPVRQVVETIWDLTDAQGRVLPGALPYRPGAPMTLAADAEHTERLIGWRARTPLRAGLQTTITQFSQGQNL